MPVLEEPLPPTHSKHAKHKSPDKPAVDPSIVIPVAPLGFAPPAAWYLGLRVSQVSLSFLDEDRLLFTFRIPGLISRDKSKTDNPSPDERREASRHIRALVLELPAGKVAAEAIWELHDGSRYLWPLKDQKFLLRDKNQIQTGDASLHLEPFLRFPGPVSSLDLSPDQRLLVTNTTEPPAPEANSESSATPSAASATITVSGHPAPDVDPPSASTQDLLRILRMDSRTVMLFSRVAGTTHVPIDGEGYYEALRGKASSWLINYQEFRGGSTPIASFDSTCSPALEVPAPGIVLASACTEGGGRRVIALTRSPIAAPAKPESKKDEKAAKDRERDKSKGKQNDKAETTHLLWDMPVLSTNVWPQLTSSFEGRRIARATLSVAHSIGISSPLDREDIRGQTVQVYDLATGQAALTVPANPALDGGGNFALSPSGKRFAILNDGAIQIYDLPPAPELPPPAIKP